MYLPESITTLLGETAADSKYPCGLKACLSSIKKLENAFLSDSGPWSQLVCILLVLNIIYKIKIIKKYIN